MADACKRLVAHQANVFPWGHELLFCRLKCPVLRAELAENILRWPSIKNIDKVTMFITPCHLLMCIVAFVTISTCLMHCYGLFKTSTLIYWIYFKSHAGNSFIYLNVQIALEKTNMVQVTTEVDKLIYFTCSI